MTAGLRPLLLCAALAPTTPLVLLPTVTSYRAQSLRACLDEPTDEAQDVMDESEFVVSLREPGGRETLLCYISASAEHDGTMFAALCPVDVPISLAQLSSEGRLVPIEESDDLVAAAASECAKLDIQLLDTPVVLTAQGSGLQELYNQEGEEDDDDDDANGDGDGEEAIVLAEFAFEGSTVFVMQTLEMLFVVGKEDGDGDAQFVVPTDAEMEPVADRLEEMLQPEAPSDEVEV